MAQNIQLIVYPAKDLDAAKAFFSKYLGVEPYADSPYYVGYKPSPTDELEIGLDPSGTEVISYKHVTDIESELQALVDAGAILHQEPTDVGGGLLIAKVKDANGNVLGLRQSPQ
jgi:predicted enzyme related to lactoylglutathione lyase